MYEFVVPRSCSRAYMTWPRTRMAARSSTTCCVRGIPSTSTRTSSRCYSRETTMLLGRTEVEAGK